VTKDVQKLKASNSNDRFLLVFGPGKILAAQHANSDGKDLSWGGEVVRWEAGKTDYAARWIKV
jgi:hypothetical protein